MHAFRSASMLAARPRVLALNVHITLDAKQKSYSAEHPGHGAWATLRHEIDLPHSPPPTQIQCVVVLHPGATAAAQVENFRACAFLAESSRIGMGGPGNRRLTQADAPSLQLDTMDSPCDQAAHRQRYNP